MTVKERQNTADQEAFRAMSQDHKQSVLLRAQAYDSGPKLTGFEDESTRNLIIANQYLRRGRVATLKPLLPLLLKLKGKPYRLHSYFPFEPFFRTRMPKTVLLKTGRQVSKCMHEDQPVLLADGRRVAAKEIQVGDAVLSWSSARHAFVPRRVTRVWRPGVKPLRTLATKSGFSCRVTGDHRLLVRDGDNHFESYIESRFVYQGDYLATRKESTGRLDWERVSACYEDGAAETVDIEVEVDHNFVMDRAVSHNSTSLAAQGIVFSNSIPYFSTLYVTPLFEMIRRFSHNYVREFIEQSPLKRLFTSSKTTNQILQRSFVNGAAMYFSYAFLDAERTRGIPADKNVIDEVQDMNYDFLQIIHETLSGSPWALRQYAGTPKSMDNTMQALWEDSSQAEWMIKCRRGGCGAWNVPAADWDLMEMTGPWHRGISEAEPGIICATCAKPLDPRTGRWVHAYPERRWSFAGYHVPQQIMPIHYASQEKWDILVGKKEGRVSGTTPTTFKNEVCGESCDAGSKLITVTDLKAAATLPWPPRASELLAKINPQKRYVRRILGVDWGGGGGKLKGSSSHGKEEKRNRTSFTTLCAAGMLPSGKIEIYWGHRSTRTHDFEYEALLVLEALHKLRCTHLAHDFSNAGEGRIVLVNQAGVPPTNILNMRYHGIGHSRMSHHPADDDCPYDWYSLDKSQCVVTTTQSLRHRLIETFAYDHVNADQPGLLHDFLALIEEKVDSRLGTDIYTITRNPNKPDDFAHSVVYACCALWWMCKKWPDIAEAARMKVPKDWIKHIHPRAHVDWDDI